MSGASGVALLCGLILVLLSLRVADGHQRARDFVALGLVAGVGWWSSPEIVYFVLPAIVLLVQSFRADLAAAKGARWVRLLLIGVVAACLGALPWLWANLHSGFASFNQTAYAQCARVHRALAPVLPLLGGHALQPAGLGLGGLAPVAAACGGGADRIPRHPRRRRCAVPPSGGRSLAIAVGVLAFPLLVAYSPASWFWQDGRYVGYVVPLFVLVLVVGCADLARRLRPGRPERDAGTRTVGRLLAAGLATALVALTVANFAVFGIPHQSFFANWGDPNRPSQDSAAKLESAGVHDGYADYWVAYRLDFLTGGELRAHRGRHRPGPWGRAQPEGGLRRDARLDLRPDHSDVLRPNRRRPQMVGPAGISERIHRRPAPARHRLPDRQCRHGACRGPGPGRAAGFGRCPGRVSAVT